MTTDDEHQTLMQGPEGAWYACGRADVADVRGFLTRLGAIAARYDVTCQAVRADAVAGKAHLDYCVAKALRAHRRGENLAQEVGLTIARAEAERRDKADLAVAGGRGMAAVS